MNATRSSLVLFGLCLLISSLSIGQHKKYVEPFFKTGDRIFAHPMLDGELLFVGSNDNKLYALDSETGELRWKFPTQNNVQAAPVIRDTILYFYNEDGMYAINRESGKTIWNYLLENPGDSERLDPWDYHHGAPVINEKVVHFGAGNGFLYTFDQLSGDLLDTFLTIDSAPIRCTPVIHDGVLYFGDWNGRIYAWDIQQRDTMWTYKTYVHQPYPTFGQINGELTILDSLLIFGSRNPKIQVININTGSPAWSYEIKDGGWISGDPLLVGDTLYIAGSDCHRLFAFNAHHGEIYWTYDFLLNNFSKPALAGDQIFITTGDAYAYSGENVGNGYLYALDKNDGSIINFSLIGGNSFTSPLIYGDRLFIGSDDSNIYSIDYQAFLSDTTSLLDKGYQSFDSVNIDSNPMQINTSIKIKMNYPCNLKVSIYDLDGNLVTNLHDNQVTSGNFSVKWDGMDNHRNEVPQGYYLLEVRSNEYLKNYFMQKK